METEELREEVKEKKPKKGISSETLEVIVVIFLGITALTTAWASWISSLHGGNQATNYTTSNNIAADGNSRYNQAAQAMMQDMMLWNDISDLQLEIVYAQSIDDKDALELAAYKLYYKAVDNLTEDMAAAIGWDPEAAAAAKEPVDYVLDWIEQPEAGVSPFTDEAFINAYFEDANAVLEEANEYLEQGKQDNANGDAYNLVTVLYSVVLFLFGIVGTFKSDRNKKILIVIAGIAFLLATIYMFTIKMPTGFNIGNFFIR